MDRAWTKEIEIAIDFANANIQRVDSLLSIYHAWAKGKGRRDIVATDILRATVVLLHATLESFLRDLAEHILPHMKNSKALDPIPLAGRTSDSDIKLGALARHRGKTVDKLIEESVRLHVATENYSNTKQIVGLLRSIGVKKKTIEHLLPELGRLIKRRHHIVHQADKNPKKGKGHHVAQPIGPKTVEGWANTVLEFAQCVVDELLGKPQ